MLRSDHQAHKLRYHVIDLMRGLAIIAMMLFHMSWDLEFFGFVERGLTFTPQFKLFARCIASSFLFLAGFSFVLTHYPDFKPQSFRPRFFKLVIAAVIISLATYFAFPDSFIFFGILHAIALFSFLAIALIKLPIFILAGLAFLAIAAPHFLRHETFDQAFFWWLGLSATIPRSVDYVPLSPWIAPFLFGLTLAKYLKQHDLLTYIERLQAQPYQNPVFKTLSYLGRHSFAVYLIHQPILLGLIGAIWYIFK